MAAYTTFETAVGVCGIAWSDRGVAGVQLPEDDVQTLRRQMTTRFNAVESTAPEHVQRVIDAVVRLMNGEREDLGFAELDLDAVPEFHKRVYEVARTIPPG